MKESLLGKAMARIGVAARAFVALLSLTPSRSASAADVNQIVKYKGQELLECTLRDIISSNPFWSKLWDDLLLKGSANVAMAPELKGFTGALENSQELEPRVLSQFIQRLPQLKKQMRAGSCASLEKLAYKRFVQMATNIQESNASLGTIDLLTGGLMLFKDTPGVLQLIGKLETYRKENISLLASREVTVLCKDFG